MSNEKVKATVKTSSGTELTIESDRQTVQEIVAEIYRRDESRARFREDFEKRRILEKKRFEELLKKGNELTHSPEKSKNNINRNSTKMETFLGLIKNSFFKEPKNIGEVQKALQEKGYHYPVTSLSPTLLRLVRKGMLSRVRNENDIWVYSSGETK